MWLSVLFSAISMGACEKIPSFWEANQPLEILSQEKTEWCFAHAVSNLLKVKLRKEVDVKNLAMRFHLWENPLAKADDSRFQRVGGNVPQTLRLAISQGVCLGNPCTPFRLTGGWKRGMQKTVDSPLVPIIDRVIEEGEPLVLSIDLGFLRDRGRFPHALLIVGRRASLDGECEYLAIDSNRPSQGWQREYFQRNQGGRFYLKASEVEKYGIRMDYIRGKISAFPSGK